MFYQMHLKRRCVLLHKEIILIQTNKSNFSLKYIFKWHRTLPDKRSTQNKDHAKHLTRNKRNTDPDSQMWRVFNGV